MQGGEVYMELPLTKEGKSRVRGIKEHKRGMYSDES